MKNKNRMLFIVIPAVLAAAALAQKPETHPVADKQGRCATCHVLQTPALGSHDLRPDIDKACMECHPRSRENHSIGVTPSFSVPHDLLLSPDGKLSCITCHNPHAPRWSDHSWQAKSIAGSLGSLFSKRHQTYFLRRNNAHGDLCLSCHHTLEEK